MRRRYCECVCEHHMDVAINIWFKLQCYTLYARMQSYVVEYSVLDTYTVKWFPFSFLWFDGGGHIWGHKKNHIKPHWYLQVEDSVQTALDLAHSSDFPCANAQVASCHCCCRNRITHKLHTSAPLAPVGKASALAVVFSTYSHSHSNYAEFSLELITPDFIHNDSEKPSMSAAKAATGDASSPASTRRHFAAGSILSVSRCFAVSLGDHHHEGPTWSDRVLWSSPAKRSSCTASASCATAFSWGFLISR